MRKSSLKADLREALGDPYVKTLITILVLAVAVCMTGYYSLPKLERERVWKLATQSVVETQPAQ